MRATHVLLLITMLLGACGSEPETLNAPGASVPEPRITAPAAEVVVDSGFTIVMLGDSLTAGYGLRVDEALPEQMAEIFARNGFDVNVVNAGVSGDTTAAALARYDWSVASAEPDLMIVALGANDFFNGSSPAAAKENLAAIIERAQGDDVPVILAGLQPGDIEGREVRIAEFGAIYPELAETYNVPLFDDILGGVRGNPDLVQLDGLHPTKAGVKIMAARMSKFVGAYLPELMASVGAPS